MDKTGRFRSGFVDAVRPFNYARFFLTGRREKRTLADRLPLWYCGRFIRGERNDPRAVRLFCVCLIIYGSFFFQRLLRGMSPGDSYHGSVVVIRHFYLAETPGKGAGKGKNQPSRQKGNHRFGDGSRPFDRRGVLFITRAAYGAIGSV